MAYTPFIDYITLGSYWYLLLIPLSASIAIVYKALKVRNVRQLPAAAAGLTVTILAGMAVAAAVLWAIYTGFSYLQQ